MDKSQPIYNAAKAKEILENEVFLWAFDEITQEVTKQWQESPARDTEGREKLWLMLQMAQKFKIVLTSLVETGQIRELEQLRERTMLQRMRDSVFPV